MDFNPVFAMADNQNPKSFEESLSRTTAVKGTALAWDILGVPERGPTYQPWRAFWPPKNIEAVSANELKAKPWLTWKRDSNQPNEKPWYAWVNIFEGEVDEPCGLPDSGSCDFCAGEGCVRALKNSLSFIYLVGKFPTS